MLTITEIVKHIATNTSCVIQPPNGLPTLTTDLTLPNDVAEFYNLCGGATLFMGQDYQIRVVGPSEFVRANPVIVGEPCEYDKSYNWFIIANDDNGQYITIDLSAATSGRCYDSFLDTYGLQGDTPIIAASFTEFLNLLFEGAGQYFYWLELSFMPLGDAYS